MWRLKPKRILEYGSGEASTPLFLGYTYVEHMVTVETSPKWRKWLSEHCPDPRLEVHDGGYPAAADFDLVLIDDGDNDAHRFRTIHHVLSEPHPTVVIHDADHGHYQTAIREHVTDFEIYRTSPHTAVIPATNTQESHV